MNQDAAQIDDDKQKRQRIIYLKLRVQELKKEMTDAKAELDQLRASEPAA